MSKERGRGGYGHGYRRSNYLPYEEVIKLIPEDGVSIEDLMVALNETSRTTLFHRYLRYLLDTREIEQVHSTTNIRQVVGVRRRRWDK